MTGSRDFRVLAAVVGALTAIVALSAVVALPGERQVKGLVGLDYKEPGCGPVHDRGRFGAWRKERPLPAPLEEARSVTVGDGAVLAGGVVTRFVEGAARSTARVSRYDFETGELTPLPPLPLRVNHASVVTHARHIYVVGGDFDRPSEQESSDRVWRLRPGSERWSEVGRMPTPRGALGVAVVGDTLYAMGGRSRGEPLGAVEALDLRTGSWSKLAPLRPPRDHLGAAVIDGELYIAGGRYPGGNELATFERYDPVEDRWEALTDMPSGTSGAELNAVAGRLVVVGGEDSEQAWVTGTAMAYDPAAEEWSALPSTPRPKHGYASAVFGDRLYLIGGSRCGASVPTASVESLRVTER